MPSPNAKAGRTGRPPVTSRAEILTAARKLIDRHGWEKVTIRALAGELGIGGTTLYRHVKDKEDLLLLLMSEYAAQLPQPTLPSDPRERIIAAAITIRDALTAWPWSADVLTTDGFIGRLGDSALWLVEAIVAGAIDHGCSPERAVHIFRDLWYYTVGEVLVRAHSSRGHEDVKRPAFADPGLVDLDPSRTPHLADIGGRWAVLAAQDTYSQGVRAFVDGLLAQATADAPDSKRR
ncbi:DNA-binding transcriptional regulator, AcrR family [Actinokineospora alba]|uniref:DNA-binding transcriptional regulator, AcrR family n=1 Tax=Actinokineospora alba TaxID=504798 RepID=A0A1H0FWD6_9PSEU|nr:TetR/AcrR family transcriptional regulator [Actinokineospora alba]TDP69644.1 TetR family transcriptional regulator [Actinokineospora alba]SDI12168.1 DNA-binding transcriptional regulator, AcrR family [Actinokineospora alba]SDN98789.1 DNA-binding transcriptional regulator, AcrR family [Actinokineospora alba]